jgi:hypothetical protein
MDLVSNIPGPAPFTSSHWMNSSKVAFELKNVCDCLPKYGLFNQVDVTDNLIVLRLPECPIAANMFPNFALENLWELIHQK